MRARERRRVRRLGAAGLQSELSEGLCTRREFAHLLLLLPMNAEYALIRGLPAWELGEVRERLVAISTSLGFWEHGFGSVFGGQAAWKRRRAQEILAALGSPPAA